jgi:diguanylate cyclase (GGDEF)-like protein
MEKLNSHQSNYTIISIDLDHLKTINDTYGHMSGDRYIANFAKIIKEVFSDALLRARIGGDEFIVILDHSNEEDCINTLKTFDAVLKLESNTSNEFNYQASYGYAIHGFDNNLSTHEIYMLADRNMYTMKQEHHKANKEGE